MNAEQALSKLIEGNKRYVTERYAPFNVGSTRRYELTKEQKPFAVILGCSDSRIPPEIVFDQGLGDLFVIRTAGHVVDNVVVGSIEFAIEYLKVRLIVVLGHEDCGAVKAAMTGEPVPGQIAVINNAIHPAVQNSKTQHGNLITNAIKFNTKLTVEKLGSTPIIQEAITQKILSVHGAIFDLLSGEAVFI
jgi:carbonic anhydrase